MNSQPLGNFVYVYVHVSVCAGLVKGREGRLRTPVVVEGRRLPALTYFRVRQSSEGLAWVELSPQTGGGLMFEP